jgi:hypothetical protein
MLLEINIAEELCNESVINVAAKAKECIELYAKKNHDYGNSFDKGCDAIGPAYAIGRIYNKVDRLITITKTESEVKDESVEDTLKDLACYSLMYLAYLDKKRAADVPEVEFE